MKREIIQTSDGSTTIYIPEWHESYHSRHGAVQEAYHVFIKNGLHNIQKEEVSILEIGFGTGLNALITFIEAQKINKRIDYTGIEAYPLERELISQMNFSELFGNDYVSIFNLMHQAEWEMKDTITSDFYFTKHKMFFQEIDFSNKFDLIYFDAFGYRVQPELWSEEIFTLMYNALRTNGVLVTYACRSVIKEAMMNSGFAVQKLPGAPGKREMLRAVKL